MFFDSMIDTFDFNPLEVGNPMSLGYLEENCHSNFVNGTSNYSSYRDYLYNDDDDEIDDDDDYDRIYSW